MISAVNSIATYTYLFADLRPNATLAELPLTGVSFDSQLNAIGGFKGSLPLGDAGVAKLDPIGSTQPARTAIYVDRDGTLVWGGILWTRVYDSTKRTLDLGGSEFLSYWQHRNVNAVLDANNIDQMDLARQVATYVASQTGGDIGITASTGTSPQMRTLHYDPWDLKNAYSVLSETSALEYGFDFAVDVQYVSGVPTKTLTLSYPRRGRNFLNTGHLFEYPGNIQSYVWTEDGTQSANTIYVTGSGSGPNQLISTAANASLIDSGYPLLEAVIPSKSIDSQYYLDSQARAHLTALSSPVVIPEITVRGDLDPIFGSYIVGDDIRIRITDERFPAGFDLTPAPSFLQFTFHPVAGYQYIQPTSVSAYTLQAGDYVEYDVYIDPANQLDGLVTFDSVGSLGALFSGGTSYDQNGVPADNIDLRPYALGRWYSRKIAVPAASIGGTTAFLFGYRGFATGTMDAWFRNVRITDGAGTVRKRIWIDPDPNPTFTLAYQSGGTLWSETLVTPQAVHVPSQSIDTYRRIIGQNVTPGASGQPEVIVLALGNPV